MRTWQLTGSLACGIVCRALAALALGRLGVGRLAGVVLTHDHPDHRLGLSFILEAFPTARFYCGLSSAELPPDLRDILEKRRIPVTTLAEGWTDLQASPESRLSIFYAQLKPP